MNATDARRYRRSSDPRVRADAERVLAAEATAKVRKRDRRKPEVEAANKRKGEGDAAWRDFVAWVREVIWRLSQGRCEHCERRLLPAEGEMDHARGGAYRREFTRIDWCRRLCGRCHPMRTANKTPEGETSAAYWRDQMEAVRVRRVAEQSSQTIAALVAAEERMLAVLDPRRRRPSVPIEIEVKP